MKKLQTLGAALLLIMALSITTLADCPTGGIMGTGGICTNGIMGTGAPATESEATAPSATETGAPNAGTIGLLVEVGLSVWQSITGRS